jgi:hypothetical protein
MEANHPEGSQREHIRDEVEITQHANYDRDHGVPDTLDANNPIQATELWHMHDQERLRRARYDQDNDPPIDLYVIQRLMPHQQAGEQSTTSLCSHDVSKRSDTPRILSQPLRSMTDAPTQAYGSRCTTSQHAPLEATETTWRDTSPL